MNSRGRAKERFVFGIPLIARAVAQEWERVETLVDLTLRSVLAQTDPEFEVLLVGHDRPACWESLTRRDPRFCFLQADWNPQEPSPRNDDAGIKKWHIKERVGESGGGLLMYLDADDLVDRHLVEIARAEIRPEHVGGVVDKGVIADFETWRAISLPEPRVYNGRFHELCGSSTIGRIEPDSPDAVRRDPHEALGSHHRWPERANEIGVELAKLPVWGAYLVNTSQNHSEAFGPFAEWRRTLNASVAREGSPLSPDMESRFGLRQDDRTSVRTGGRSSSG